jgi:hypothetical protein
MISEKRILHDFVSECFRFQFEGSPEAESILGTVGLIPVEKASLTGVRQAVADCVEMLIDLEGDRLGALNEQLSSHGVPTLSQMRNAWFMDLLRILGRGRIRSDDEWRLVNGYLSDTENRGLEMARAAEVLVAQRFPGAVERCAGSDACLPTTGRTLETTVPQLPNCIAFAP